MPGAHASCILGTLCFFEQGTAHLSRASRSPQTVSSVRNTSLLASHLSMEQAHGVACFTLLLE